MALDTVQPTDDGRVVETRDGMARVRGLPRVAVGEAVRFEGGDLGLVRDLEVESVVCLAFGSRIRRGDAVTATGRRFDIPAGPALLGRVVNALGEPLDGLGPLGPAERRGLFSRAPGFGDVRPLSSPLYTGLEVLDLLLPIAQGSSVLVDSRGGGSLTLFAVAETERGHVRGQEPPPGRCRTPRGKFEAAGPHR